MKKKAGADAKEVMRGTVEKRTLIKEERSPINQQTVRTAVCLFVHFSCFRAVVCTS